MNPESIQRLKEEVERLSSLDKGEQAKEASRVSAELMEMKEAAIQRVKELKATFESRKRSIEQKLAALPTDEQDGEDSLEFKKKFHALERDWVLCLAEYEQAIEHSESAQDTKEKIDRERRKIYREYKKKEPNNKKDDEKLDVTQPKEEKETKKEDLKKLFQLKEIVVYKGSLHVVERIDEDDTLELKSLHNPDRKEKVKQNDITALDKEPRTIDGLIFKVGERYVDRHSGIYTFCGVQKHEGSGANFSDCFIFKLDDWDRYYIVRSEDMGDSVWDKLDDSKTEERKNTVIEKLTEKGWGKKDVFMHNGDAVFIVMIDAKNKHLDPLFLSNGERAQVDDLQKAEITRGQYKDFEPGKKYQIDHFSGDLLTYVGYVQGKEEKNTVLVFSDQRGGVFNYNAEVVSPNNTNTRSRVDILSQDELDALLLELENDDDEGDEEGKDKSTGDEVKETEEEKAARVNAKIQELGFVKNPKYNEIFVVRLSDEEDDTLQVKIVDVRDDKMVVEVLNEGDQKGDMREVTVDQWAQYDQSNLLQRFEEAPSPPEETEEEKAARVNAELSGLNLEKDPQYQDVFVAIDTAGNKTSIFKVVDVQESKIIIEWVGGDKSGQEEPIEQADWSTVIRDLEKDSAAAPQLDQGPVPKGHIRFAGTDYRVNSTWLYGDPNGQLREVIIKNVVDENTLRVEFADGTPLNITKDDWEGKNFPGFPETFAGKNDWHERQKIIITRQDSTTIEWKVAKLGVDGKIHIIDESGNTVEYTEDEFIAAMSPFHNEPGTTVRYERAKTIEEIKKEQEKLFEIGGKLPQKGEVIVVKRQNAVVARFQVVELKTENEDDPENINTILSVVEIQSDGNGTPVYIHTFIDYPEMKDIKDEPDISLEIEKSERLEINNLKDVFKAFDPQALADAYTDFAFGRRSGRDKLLQIFDQLAIEKNPRRGEENKKREAVEKFLQETYGISSLAEFANVWKSDEMFPIVVQMFREMATKSVDRLTNQHADLVQYDKQEAKEAQAPQKGLMKKAVHWIKKSAKVMWPGATGAMIAGAITVASGGSAAVVGAVAGAVGAGINRFVKEQKQQEKVDTRAFIKQNAQEKVLKKFDDPNNPNNEVQFAPDRMQAIIDTLLKKRKDNHNAFPQIPIEELRVQVLNALSESERTKDLERARTYELEKLSHIIDQKNAELRGKAADHLGPVQSTGFFGKLGSAISQTFGVVGKSITGELWMNDENKIKRAVGLLMTSAVGGIVGASILSTTGALAKMSTRFGIGFTKGAVGEQVNYKEQHQKQLEQKLLALERLLLSGDLKNPQKRSIYDKETVAFNDQLQNKLGYPLGRILLQGAKAGAIVAGAGHVADMARAWWNAPSDDLKYGYDPNGKFAPEAMRADAGESGTKDIDAGMVDAADEALETEGEKDTGVDTGADGDVTLGMEDMDVSAKTADTGGGKATGADVAPAGIGIGSSEVSESFSLAEKNLLNQTLSGTEAKGANVLHFADELEKNDAFKDVIVQRERAAFDLDDTVSNEQVLHKWRVRIAKNAGYNFESQTYTKTPQFEIKVKDPVTGEVRTEQIEYKVHFDEKNGAVNIAPDEKFIKTHAAKSFETAAPLVEQTPVQKDFYEKYGVHKVDPDAVRGATSIAGRALGESAAFGGSTENPSRVFVKGVPGEHAQVFVKNHQGDVYQFSGENLKELLDDLPENKETTGGLVETEKAIEEIASKLPGEEPVIVESPRIAKEAVRLPARFNIGNRLATQVINGERTDIWQTTEAGKTVIYTRSNDGVVTRSLLDQLYSAAQENPRSPEHSVVQAITEQKAAQTSVEPVAPVPLEETAPSPADSFELKIVIDPEVSEWSSEVLNESNPLGVSQDVIDEVRALDKQFEQALQRGSQVEQAQIMEKMEMLKQRVDADATRDEV